MKALLTYLLGGMALTTASYIGAIRTSPSKFLQNRDIAYLGARSNEQDRNSGNIPQHRPPPTAIVNVRGPARIFTNGPESKHTFVGVGRLKNIASKHPTTPYVDARLLGQAEEGLTNQQANSNPIHAMAKGKKATAQIAVPRGGHGVLRIKNSEMDHTIQVPGPDSKRLSVQSEQHGGAEAYATVTRPGAVNVYAER